MNIKANCINYDIIKDIVATVEMKNDIIMKVE